MAEGHLWEVGEVWEERQVKGWGVVAALDSGTEKPSTWAISVLGLIVGQALGSCPSCWW